MMKIGVAPVIDLDAPVPAGDPDGVVIIGAIVVAYAQTAKEAQQDRNLLGTEIAYYDRGSVVATSFTRGATGEEDTAKQRVVSELLRSGAIAEGPTAHRVSLGGVDYIAAAVKMPWSSTRKLPHDYPPVTAGAVVLAPISDPQHGRTVKLFTACSAAARSRRAARPLPVTPAARPGRSARAGRHRHHQRQCRSHARPIGLELDGLANGLNVMLARLLGRPEPGEEEFDEEGNPIMQGRVEFDEGDGSAALAPDPELAALAQESEPDYYKRVYTEYLAARRASGNPDEVSFENFIAKLKVNEGKLKAQYQCRAVRFRLV
jgi:hypothetical protein